MTRLPEIKEKYYRKALGCDYMVVVEKIEEGKIICSIVQGYGKEFERFTYLPDSFWQDYRELTEREKQLLKDNQGLWDLIQEKKKIREDEIELQEVHKHISYLEDAIVSKQQELEKYKIRKSGLQYKINNFLKSL